MLFGCVVQSLNIGNDNLPAKSLERLKTRTEKVGPALANRQNFLKTCAIKRILCSMPMWLSLCKIVVWLCIRMWQQLRAAWRYDWLLHLPIAVV